jgi:SAM-dependent methyltransferase
VAVTHEKYGPQAGRWTEDAYADPDRYLERRAALVATLGPELAVGGAVLDLACGDGGLGQHLLRRGFRYLGVDLSPEMVDAARRRLGDSARIEPADLNDYEPPEPVAATACFRAIYYARDRVELFRRIAGYTERKLVFDLNPRQYRVEDVRADLRAAGFGRLDLRPFFVPQTRALPRAGAALFAWAEGVPSVARALLRVRFTYVCAASRS